jgi:hypothetical protein
VNVRTLQLWRQIIHGRSEELIPETQLEILVVHVLKYYRPQSHLPVKKAVNIAITL